MGRPKNDHPAKIQVRLTDDAVKWAERACGFTRESISQYVSRVIEERAPGDVSRALAELVARGELAPEPPAPPVPPTQPPTPTKKKGGKS